MRVDKALQTFWRGREGYNIACSEELAIEKVADPSMQKLAAVGPSTYGEVTARGVRQLGQAMGLAVVAADVAAPASEAGSESVEPIIFMDLGSGVGRLVAQAYLEWPSVLRSVGVELSPTRWGRAVSAWESMTFDGDADDIRASAMKLARGCDCRRAGDMVGDSATAAAPAAEAVQLLQGDLLAADVSKATHIFVASLCFNDALLDRLTDKLANEATRLRTVATLRRFPQGLPGFNITGRIRIETSWNGKGEVTWLYERCTSSTAVQQFDLCAS